MPIKKKSPAAKSLSSVGQSVNIDLWQPAPTELTRRCVFMLIIGDTGTGRTTLAFTAPGPIAYLHCAEKIEGIIQPHAHKVRGVFNFGDSIDPNLPTSKVEEQATIVWKKFKLAMSDAFKWARTIIVDTDSDAWELIRFAYFGDVKPSSGRLELNWGPVNSDWKNLFRLFKGQDKTNLILISQTEDEYVKGKSKKGQGEGFGTKTGRTIRKGQKSIPYMADVIIRTESSIGNREFSSVIEKPWWNGEMLGVEVPQEVSNFPSIMGMITEMGEEEWSK